jgi:opacity protein-like surface antigen
MSIAKWSFTGATLLMFGATFASAQTSFDLNLGFGSAWDTAASGGIDNAASPNAFGSCAPGSGDPYCASLPSLNGFFLGFGGDLMLFKHLGAGFNASLQPTMQNYGPLQYRQAFYDFNAIYAPINTKRVSLRINGGIGAAHTGFAINESGCVGTAVCSNVTEPVGSSNHFDVTVGVGLQLYVTDHIFIRPEYDYHYANGLDNQFGHNYVSEAMVWVGYSFGER